jgi:hypothetical protein
MAARRQLTTPDATIPYASRPISVPGVERATTGLPLPVRLRRQDHRGDRDGAVWAEDEVKRGGPPGGGGPRRPGRAPGEYEPQWADLARANLDHAHRVGTPGRGAVIRGDATVLAALLPAVRHGRVAQPAGLRAAAERGPLPPTAQVTACRQFNAAVQFLT